MILTVRRSSGFPLLLEPSDLDILDALEAEGRYLELECFERELRHSDDLKDLKVEVTKLEELLIFLDSLNHKDPITIHFRKGLVILEDNGDMGC